MLKALELFGFKSFADRTVFDFASGITCVVGPNGSGKSNVVDAIKWIMGDQSPKSLRGKEMTDVIFNGSTSRKPAGFAEALLTFDNTKRTFHIEADSVVIGRRIYRSGEAEYLINRVPARLKDIKDLFLGTGAGTAAYSIIEQGRVDQLLQSSNTARRTVFEEAAGISRFKLRKVDAERKLERVAQNLLRLTDIVKEVETQLTATRTQASKAAKFREYNQELKTLRAGSAADDFRDFTARLQRLEEERGTLANRVEAASAQAADCEGHQRAFEGELVAAEDTLRAVERREAEYREAVARHEATLRHQAQRLQELDTEYERLDQQQRELAERAQQVAGELEQTEASLTSFTDDLERRQSEITASLDEAHTAAIEVERFRESRETKQQEMLALVRRISTAGSRGAGLEAQRTQREATLAQLEEQQSRAEIQLAVAQREFDRLKQASESAAAAHASLKAQQTELVAKRASLQADSTETQQALSALREQRASLLARKTLLEEFERRQDGVGVGVREILALAGQASGPPWNHVVGHVIDLIECDIENAALVEVALGNRAHLLVLDDAEPLLASLRSGACRISGRVGFVILPTSADSGVNDDGRLESQTERASVDLTGYAGVVCRADQLVRTPDSVPRLAAHLLADTWIVRTLDAATALLQATGSRCRFVTLQGELVEPNGTLYLGSLAGESSTISRKSELRTIRSDLVRADRQIAAAEQSLVRLKEELAVAASEELRLQFDADLGAHHLAEMRSGCSAADLEVQRSTQLLDRLAEDGRQLRDQIAELVPATDLAREELAQAEYDQESLQSELQSLERKLASAEGRHRDAQTRHATEQRDLARFEERLQNLRISRSRLDQERFQRDMQHEEADRRFQTLAARRVQIEAEATKTEVLLTELASQYAGLADEVAVAQQTREKARNRRGELAERDLALRHELRTAQESLHACQMQTADLKHQLASVADRLRDEFQMEIEEALNAGYSARTLLRDQAAEGNQEESEGNAAPSDNSGSAEADRQQAEEQIHRLRRKLKQLGHVNADSLKELDELESRFSRLSGQLQDLVEAKNSLEEIIRKINQESRRIFLDCFTEIRKNFQELFRKLFGGGEGDVVLENPDDVLECGIDVVARPPGKELRSLSLLSGGEKTMAAVALLLAIFKSKPSPFCILDEVDAALDEGNVNRYLNVIREFQEWTQFIVVTHNKRTMSGAEVLYGVTMEEAGISKRMSVRFEDVSEDGNFKVAA